MAGYFAAGETKVRPGAYFNISSRDVSAADVINGVTAVIFRADFGPLGQAVEISWEEGYEKLFGTGGTTDAMKQAFRGGAQTVIACRLGSGGANASITLNDKEGAAVATLSTKYPGSKAFSVTMKEKLTDPAKKQCVIYAGTKEFEKVDFAAGENEAQAFADAMASSSSFTVSLEEGKGGAVLADVSQGKLEGGTDPVIKTKDYSDAFAAAEPFMFNTICVDTEEPSVHLLLHAFVNRIFEAGSLAQAVVAETGSVEFEDRLARAASYNDEKMVYVLNPKADASGETLDGYQTAALVAGMIGAVASNVSLTHAVISGFTGLYEEFTNTDIVRAEKSGCVVLARSSKGQIWIDSAINTLVELPEDKDAGWKKIRRVKTRFELLRRCNETVEALIGKVDNDGNGRTTILSQLNGVGQDMIAEGKLASFSIAESSRYKPDGDSCWFELDVVDKDSAEHIYSLFSFQYSVNVG